MTKSIRIQEIDSQSMKKDIPHFSIGDTIDVHCRIIEGDKERIQVFTGTVIGLKGRGLSQTVTLYRVSYGSSMERVFNLHSPRVAKIALRRKGKVRRAKLTYLRGKKGRQSKVQEQLFGVSKSAVAERDEAEVVAAPAEAPSDAATSPPESSK